MRQQLLQEPGYVLTSAFEDTPKTPSCELCAAKNCAERHKILTGIGAATAAGAGYEIYEHEKKKYDERRQQGAPPPQGGEARAEVIDAHLPSVVGRALCMATPEAATHSKTT